MNIDKITERDLFKIVKEKDFDLLLCYSNQQHREIEELKNFKKEIMNTVFKYNEPS